MLRPNSRAVVRRPWPGSDRALDQLRQLRLANGANLGRGDLAILEHHQRGDAAHRVLTRRVGVFVDIDLDHLHLAGVARSEEHTSELQSLMRISYAVFCLKKKKKSIINEQQKQYEKHNASHY